MADYINREVALKILTRIANCVSGSSRRAVTRCVREIASLAPADVEPVRHGAWYPRFEDWRQQQEGNKCSVCGFEYYGTGIRSFHYCPNCGAKMDLI